MGTFKINWIDFLIQEERKRKEQEANNETPYVQLPIPQPPERIEEQTKDKKDSNDIIIIDM